MKRCAIILVSLILLTAAVMPQRRGGGGSGGGSGRGPGPHYGGWGSQTVYDQDGDGIDDRFQQRYRQKQAKKFVSGHAAVLNGVLALPDDASLKMVCTPGDIPGLDKDIRRQLEARKEPTAPQQFAAGADRTLTILYTWTETEGLLVRWAVIQEGAALRSLEGTPVSSRLGRWTPLPDYKLPATLTWKAEESAP
ncbi:MAG TPA: hypothetical protein PLY66_02700 [Acidobacteriota bacterium]|nr:hypothetical protein [Acidobacteriota bacterium]HQF87906.1 hypothetical protein [Acidobacteriota bacterium]HQG92284.1 hypothetical protein [Acidobacteriota bacterium]HQK89036.1 hypothetical protein [Acidobacteriota bacterium]